MNVSRRELLIAAGASTVVLGGCGRVASAVREISLTQRTPPQLGDDPFVNLLNRFAFGPTAAEVETLRAVGADHWFESQLSPAPIALALDQSLASIFPLRGFEI